MKDILANNPYKSFTNMKTGNKAHWFSDGEKYFADLSEKLMEAKESIFMTDWWMSPELWLVRPVQMNSYLSLAYLKRSRKENPPYSRLMDILYQCANRGVKIYIQLFGENSVLTLDSVHTQNTLTALHPNIHVVRHPFNNIAFLWSHHEKLVIIDQIIGYVGGLDLCWGRFDTNEHPIYEPENNTNDPQYLFPGIDYSNARIRDFNKVYDYLKESSIRGKETRMPWHDVHCRIIGPAVSDIARHFVERWNFTKFGTGEGITDIKQSSSVSKEKKTGGFMMNLINQANQKNEENINNNSEVLIPVEEKKEFIEIEN
jgi:phospholipase D1/2